MDLLNKKILYRQKISLKDNQHADPIREGVVTEISSDNQFIKINNNWYNLNDGVQILSIIREDKLTQLLNE